jgi:hypothetical protein
MTESPYFAKLLSKNPLKKEAPVNASVATSDIVQDGIILKLDPDIATQPGPDLTFYSIVVTSPNYNTFAAIMIWLVTKYLIFATASSDGTKQDAPSPTKRRKTNASTPIENPYVLPKITWKSAFRAAHLFEIKSLKGLALSEFERTLTTDNAARELFDPLSAAHLDVRAVALDFAVKNWQAVEGTNGMKEIEELIEEGKIEKGGEIAIKLARRLKQV